MQKEDAVVAVEQTMEHEARFPGPEPTAGVSSIPSPSLRGGVETRTKARHQFVRRFLYSDLQPLTEQGIAPDPHPEGPSSLLAEAPADIQEELARERGRERLRKAAVFARLPRLTQAAASRDAFLEAAGHTAQGSQSLRIYEENELSRSLREGDDLSAVLEQQRRDLWFDRAKTERDDLGRETRMLNEAMRILRSNEDVVNSPSPDCDVSSDKVGATQRQGSSVPQQYAFREQGQAPATVLDNNILQEVGNSNFSRASSISLAADDCSLSDNSLLDTPQRRESSSSVRTAESKIDQIYDRQAQVQKVTEAQAILTNAKKTAMDLMFLAEKAEQEANKEADRLQDMQRAPSHSEEGMFDNRVRQRRTWMEKNEVALQSRLRYQEAVESLHQVQTEWGPALGLEVSFGSSPRTTSSRSSNQTRSTSSGRVGRATRRQSLAREGSATLSTTKEDEMIRLWVIGVVAVNITGETLSRAYYGSFSEADTVPSDGWIAFDEGSEEISIRCVVPNKTMRKRKQPHVETWVVDGTPFPEVNGRYMERGTYNGAPRYRNPNNIFLFRHAMSRSEELGITRQTCLPESKLVDEDAEAASETAALTLDEEVPGKMTMDFPRLVKTSLQSINLDRQERVRLSHERITRAVAKVDSDFQEQMSNASASLEGVQSSEHCGESMASSTTAGEAEKSRDMAVMAASDSAKLSFQEHTGGEDRVIPCPERGVAPLCKRWVANACPKRQIHCRCRHYFISIPERDNMVAWREGKCARAELEVLACIARREALLFEAQEEGAACNRRFLSDTRTHVEEGDVISLLNLLDQLRLASVQVVEAVDVWREDMQGARNNPLPNDGNRRGERRGRRQRPKEARLRKKLENHGKVSHQPKEEVERTDDFSRVEQSTTHRSGKEESRGDLDNIVGPLVPEVGAPSETIRATNQNKLRGGDDGSVEANTNSFEGGGGRKDGCRGSGNRVGKGKWVVTMMVPGLKLWDASPAIVSQFKRFRRSRQDPKIARNQLCLGVFATRNEAVEAYNDALCREAIKQRSSVLRMPQYRIITRTCGRHMAIQSDDTPMGRPCEQCAAEAFNIKYSPPYIWNNSNYLLKMTKDLEFLSSVDPLVSWLGADGGGGGSDVDAFDLKDNPFLLAPLEEEDDEGSMEQSTGNVAHASSAHSICTGRDTTPPPASSKSNVVLNNVSGAPCPDGTTSDPRLYQANNEVGGDLVLPSSPQLQQRSWTSPRPGSRDVFDNGNTSYTGQDQSASAKVLSAISALTTPRVEWANEDEESFRDTATTGGRSSVYNFGKNEHWTQPPGLKMTGDIAGARGSRMISAAAIASELYRCRGGRAMELGVSGQVDNPGIALQSRRVAFGMPSTKVNMFSNGVQEWCGETAKGGQFIIPFSSLSSSTTNLGASSYGQPLSPQGVGPGFPPRHEMGTSIEVLDIKRVEAALTILHDEEDIADAMSGKPPRDRKKYPLSRLTRKGSEGKNVTGGRRGGGAKRMATKSECNETRGALSSAVDGRAVAENASPDVGSIDANEIRQAQAVAPGVVGKSSDRDNTPGTTSRLVGKGRKMRDVLAVYRHRGAQLVLQQCRKEHPFRTEGVFCRQDRGEWAGQVHMSVNAKKFVARRLLDKVLERRNEQRGRIGRMIQKIIEQGQPIHRLAGPRLRLLLSKARDLGGDRLALDIVEAEIALGLFGRVERSATVIQAFVRGVFGRQVSKKFLQMRRKEELLKTVTMTAAGTVAEQVVEDALQEASRRATRFIRRPVTASVGVFLDGRMMIVSAVPFEQRSIAGGAPKAATEWYQLCSACLGKSAQQVWSCKRSAYEIFRGVCSCRTSRPPESVRLTAYDPITGEQICMTVSGKHLTKYLSHRRAMEDANENSYCQDRHHQQQLLTSSSSSEGNSVCHATSLAVAKRHVAAAVTLRPLPWDAVLGYGNPKREVGMIQRRFWEPYHEARKLGRVAENAQMDLLQLRKVSRALHEASEKATATEETARALHETWHMNVEHVAGRHRDLLIKFQSECQKSREALAFSWRSVQQMENRDAEDWTQAWDPFENGNNWRQLIKRRATDRELTATKEAGIFAKRAVYISREDRAESKHWGNKARAKAARAGEAEQKSTALVGSLKKQAEEAKGAANMALKLLASLSRPTVKSAGRLERRLMIEEGGHTRDQWDALFRGVTMLKTPELKYLPEGETKKQFCVTTIRREARTGAINVTATGEDKAVNIYDITMSAEEVMLVVSERVGGRRGKELISPIVMEGGYAAIRRVQEARKKEVLQVIVDSLALDIYHNTMAIGRLSFIRRRAELKSRLMESLWYQDALRKRSSGRGTEIMRQFQRLGPGWAAVTVYETWGDLVFEAYDPTMASTLMLQASLHDVLQSLSSDLAASAAFLHAVRTGTFPKKLLRQVLNRLDVVLPGENDRWWRRPIDGEVPHLTLRCGGFSDTGVDNGKSNTYQQYRGPIWTEDRFTSGKPFKARVLVSARGNFLIEMEARDLKCDERIRSGRKGVGHHGGNDLSGVTSPSVAQRSDPERIEGSTGSQETGQVLRLELTAQYLRGLFRGLDKIRHGQKEQQGKMESLLHPILRMDLCRYLLDHIVLEDKQQTSTVCSSTRGDNTLADAEMQQQDEDIATKTTMGAAPVREADIELREAYQSFEAWAISTGAPVGRSALREFVKQQRQQHEDGFTEKATPVSLSSDLCLVLRPEVSDDEHLMSIHEGSWTPDGKVWYHAKLSLLQGSSITGSAAKLTTIATGVPGCINEKGKGGGDQSRRAKRHPDISVGINQQEVSSNAELGERGLSVILWPEGPRRRRARLEKEAVVAMALEDERSRKTGQGVSRLHKEAAQRIRTVEEARHLSRLARALFTAKARHQNRADALLAEEDTLTNTWAEHDLESAREVSRSILPLLRLKTREDKDGRHSTPSLLLYVDTANVGTMRNISDGRGGVAFCRGFYVLENPLDEEPTRTNPLDEETARTTSITKPRSRFTFRGTGLRGAKGETGGRESAVTSAAHAKSKETTESSDTSRKVIKQPAEPPPLHDVGIAEDGLLRDGETRVPPPLRDAGVAGDGLLRDGGTHVPSKRRYRGEGFLERQCRSRLKPSTVDSAPNAEAVASETIGPLHDNRPMSLSQHVLRLSVDHASGSSINTTTTMIAMVRVVLEQRQTGDCDCGSTLHPGAKHLGQAQEEHQRTRKEERCEVRGVVRVEAYLPSSSKTLTLRVKVAPVAKASSDSTTAQVESISSPADESLPFPSMKATTAASTTFGSESEACSSSQESASNGSQTLRTTKGEEKLVRLVQVAHMAECWWRKQRRRALREALHTGAQRFDTEKVVGMRKTNPDFSGNSSETGQQNRDSHNDNIEGANYNALAADGQQRQNLAFSMLLIPANVLVPIQRLHIGSGSWREVIGELVGCPPGQELRKLEVNGPLVFALDSSCPATFNFKAKTLLDISVQGDVVWVQARAEDQALALLEADGQMVVRASDAADQLGRDRDEKATIAEQRSHRYCEMVKKAARRMLPALSRSYFSASSNIEDAAAAEVRALLDRAWLSRAPEFPDDAFKEMDSHDSSVDAVATSNVSTALGGAVSSSSMASIQDSLHPLHVAMELLKMHVVSCKVPGPMCPVPCCHQSREKASAHVSAHGVSTSSENVQSSDGRNDANAMLLRELERCIMCYWETKEQKRRELSEKIRDSKKGDQAKVDADDDMEDKEEAEQKNENRQPAAPLSPQTSTEESRRSLTTGAGGDRGKRKTNSKHHQQQSEAPPRPFKRALRALERLTATAGNLHIDESSGVVPSSCTGVDQRQYRQAPPPAPVSAGRVDMIREEGRDKSGQNLGQPVAECVEGGCDGGRARVREGGRGGRPSPVFPGNEKCRVSFDMIDLLTGPDGKDAWGRKVGVKSGEDVEAAVLGSGRSLISRWVMNRLKLDDRGGQDFPVKKPQQDQRVLCLDETHVAGAACISGTQFVLTISQLLDGSLSVSGHNPLTCQKVSLALGPSDAKKISRSEDLRTGPCGTPVGSVIARHIMRNAGRVLEVKKIDGGDCFALCSFNQREDDTVASSASSGAVLPHVFEIESMAHSPRSPQRRTSLEEGNTNKDLGSNNYTITDMGGKKTASRHGQVRKRASVAADEMRHMERRLWRLEAGRTRAAGIRRAASTLRVARDARKQRKMLLTSDTEALASAKASFESLFMLKVKVNESGEQAPIGAAGIEKKHVSALRDKILEEFPTKDSGSSSKKRGSMQIIVDAVRRGSAHVIAEVRERALKRPVTAERKHVGGSGSGGGCSTNSMGKAELGGKPSTIVEGDCDVLLPPPSIDDRPPLADGVDTLMLRSTEKEHALIDYDRDLSGGEHTLEEKETPSTRQVQGPQELSLPGKTEESGTLMKPRQSEQDEQRKEQHVTLIPWKSSDKTAGVAPTVPIVSNVPLDDQQDPVEQSLAGKMEEDRKSLRGKEEQRKKRRTESSDGESMGDAGTVPNVPAIVQDGLQDPRKQIVPEKTERQGVSKQEQQQGRNEQDKEQQIKHIPEKSDNETAVDATHLAEAPDIALGDLLAAVAGLSEAIERAGRPLGLFDYTSWWVGAVSEAEVEVKKKFLTPKRS